MMSNFERVAARRSSSHRPTRAEQSERQRSSRLEPCSLPVLGFSMKKRPGVVVWARVDGMPYWPAVILNWNDAVARLDTNQVLPRRSPEKRVVQFFDEEESLAVIDVDVLKEYTSHMSYVRKGYGYVNDIILACRRASVWVEQHGNQEQKERVHAPFFLALELQDISTRCETACKVFSKHRVFVPDKRVDDVLLTQARTVAPPMEPGVVVWALMDGYPWWPGVILERRWCSIWNASLNDPNAQSNHLDKGDVFVDFFNDSDYIYPVNLGKIVEYTANMSKLKDAGSKTDEVQVACVEANTWVRSNGTLYQRDKVAEKQFCKLFKPPVNVETEARRTSPDFLDLDMEDVFGAPNDPGRETGLVWDPVVLGPKPAAGLQTSGTKPQSSSPARKRVPSRKTAVHVCDQETMIDITESKHRGRIGRFVESAEFLSNTISPMSQKSLKGKNSAGKVSPGEAVINGGAEGIAGNGRMSTSRVASVPWNSTQEQKETTPAARRQRSQVQANGSHGKIGAAQKPLATRRSVPHAMSKKAVIELDSPPPGKSSLHSIKENGRPGAKSESVLYAEGMPLERKCLKMPLSSKGDPTRSTEEVIGPTHGIPMGSKTLNSGKNLQSSLSSVEAQLLKLEASKRLMTCDIQVLETTKQRLASELEVIQQTINLLNGIVRDAKKSETEGKRKLELQPKRPVKRFKRIEEEEILDGS